MSRQHDETNQRPVRGKGKPNGTGSGRLVNFQPNKEQTEILRQGFMPISTAMDALEHVVMDGHRLSLGGSLDKGGFFCIIREGISDWQNARSVSCWAGTLEKALRLAGYYLSEVNPDFPTLDRQLAFSDDW